MPARKKPSPPYRQFEYEDLVQWPREALYEYAPDIAEVDRLITKGRKSGKPRETIKALQELVNPLAEAGTFVPLASPAGEVGCITTKYLSEVLFQTRNAEIAYHETLDRLVHKRIDLVRIIGRKSCDFCTAFVDLVFSVSGNDHRYPPLTCLLFGGLPFHVACTKSIAAFIPDLADPEKLELAVLPPEDAAMLDLSFSEEDRLQIALTRTQRIMAAAG